MSRRAAAAVLIGLLVCGSRTVLAHESRPGSLEISESAAGSVEVIWKRPMQGEAGLRLVPHLSSGWLEQDPVDRYATPDYLITTWQLKTVDGQGLRGQTVTVDGLAGTLTDVLVRVRFADGREQTTLLRGESSGVALTGEPTPETGGRFGFVRLGVWHIFNGPDHLLFVLGLILIVSSVRRLVTTITGFTLGHTVTLIAASLLRLDVPVSLLNLLIAMSVLFLAPEILRAQAGQRSLTTDRPWIVASAFGLLHGLGFATGLGGVGLGGAELVSALFQFNVGVELAQLAFVAFVLSASRLLRVIPLKWPRAALRIPAYAVGIAGAIWVLQTAERVFSS